MCIFSIIQTDNIAHTIYKNINKHTGASFLCSSRNNHYGKINTLCKFEQFAFGFDSIIIPFFAPTITYHKGVEEVDVALLQGGEEVAPLQGGEEVAPLQGGEEVGALHGLLEVLVQGEGLGPGGRVDQHQDQHEDRTHDRQGHGEGFVFVFRELLLPFLLLLGILLRLSLKLPHLHPPGV